MRDRSENQITLVLLRHGATKANQEHRYLGKMEEELSEAGKRELEGYKKLQYYPKVDFLFTSPMKRCIQTAEMLYPELSPVVIEEWKEMDFGAFEGKNYRELQGDARYQAWIDSNGTLPFPEGESREQFIARCKRGFHAMKEEVERIKGDGQQKTIGMMVHGGTIMALLSSYAGGDYFTYQVKNGEGYIGTVKNFREKPEITELKKIGQETS